MDFFDKVIQDLIPDQVNATITTDGGDKLSGSFDVQRVANSHRYDINTPAVDASSQNGIVERPHRTLKEQTRCMLYSARLGIEFWADALIHEAWLYNHTYHSAI